MDKIDNPDIGKLKSKALLKLYDKKKRTLTISGVIGNINVRGGSLVPVMLVGRYHSGKLYAGRKLRIHLKIVSIQWT